MTHQLSRLLVFFALANLFASGPAATLNDTPLGQIAARLQPGAFQKLNATLPSEFESYNDFLRSVTYDPDTWNDSAHWDARRQIVLQYGDRRAPSLMIYSASDHTWRHASMQNGPPWDHHVYGSVALDPEHGHYYRERRRTLYRYIIDQDRWEFVTDRFPGPHRGGYGHTDPIEWHEALGQLIYIRDHHVYGYVGDNWKDYGRMDVHGYHSNAQYNRVRKEMLFMGGNASPQKVSILDASGRIRNLDNVPFKQAMSKTSLTYDPVSGDYLVLRSGEMRELWQLDAEQGSWQLIRNWDEDDWPFDRWGGIVPVPVDELGVIIWLNQAGPMVYRHNAKANSRSLFAPANGLRFVPVSASLASNSPSRLYDIATTLAPGEFRHVETVLPPGVETISQLNHTNWHPDDNSEGTFGVGWTDRTLFDPRSGRLFNVLMRGSYTESITWLEPDLHWDGIMAPEKSGLGGRRPYNRLMDGGDGYMYFAPQIPNNAIGRLTRAAYTDPGSWEELGVPIPLDRTGHAVGDFSTIWHPDIEKFVLYIYGRGEGDLSDEGITDFEHGHVFVWGHGDSRWRRPENHSDYSGSPGRTQSSGYGGTTIYNPIHHEVLIYGGVSHWNNAHPLGPQCTATIDRDGHFQRHGPSGLIYSAGSKRLTYHPITGDYILTVRGSDKTDLKMYIGDPPRGKPWELLYDWADKTGEERPLHHYENWHRVTPLPGTDVLIWSDLRRGIVLQRLPEPGPE